MQEDDNNYEESCEVTEAIPSVPLGYPTNLLVSLVDFTRCEEHGLMARLLASDYYAEVLTRLP